MKINPFFLFLAFICQSFVLFAGNFAEGDLAHKHEVNSVVNTYLAQQFQGARVVLFPSSTVNVPLIGVQHVIIESGMNVDNTLAAHLAGVEVHLKRGAIVSASLALCCLVVIGAGVTVDVNLLQHLQGAHIRIDRGADVQLPLFGVASVEDKRHMEGEIVMTTCGGATCGSTLARVF